MAVSFLSVGALSWEFRLSKDSTISAESSVLRNACGVDFPVAHDDNRTDNTRDQPQFFIFMKFPPGFSKRPLQASWCDILNQTGGSQEKILRSFEPKESVA